MDRAELSRLAHAAHPIAAPVGQDRLRRLVAALPLRPGARVLDLGCGRGVWLLEALRAHPGSTGVGVDLHLPPEARSDADRAGLADRVRYAQADGATWSDGAHDAVLCVGASHVLGGLDGTLAALRRHLRPGGCVLLGDGVWERPPTPSAQEALDATSEDLPDLAGLVGRAVAHGFEVLQGHVSTLEEWDGYEWSWTGSLVRWALGQPEGSPDRAQALETARTHRDQWLGGYRRQLGFATLVLVDVQAQASASATS